MSQTSQIVIANQAGAPYRSAVNDMLSALNTTFSGTTPPTTSEAYMNWLDTSVTPNVLKRRNSSDTAWELAPVVEGEINASSDKATPVDADLLAISDSADSFRLKKLSWASLKTTLNSVYARLSGGNLTGALNANKGADLPSAATVDIGAATGEYVVITGTTTITSLGTVQAGTEREVRFGSALTLTHNATSLILPSGSNILTTAGDVARFRSEGGGNWRCVSYIRNSTLPMFSILTASVATTSGTSIDFTGIPPWAKKVTVMFSGVSLSGTSNLLVQLGTSGGIEVSSYISESVTLAQAATGAAAGGSVSGYVIRMSSATAVLYGGMDILLQTSSTWVSRHNGIPTTSSASVSGGGVKTLAGVLDRIRITTTNGTDTFDAGSISLLIEGY